MSFNGWEKKHEKMRWISYTTIAYTETDKYDQATRKVYLLLLKRQSMRHFEFAHTHHEHQQMLKWKPDRKKDTKWK